MTAIFSLRLKSVLWAKNSVFYDGLRIILSLEMGPFNFSQISYENEMKKYVYTMNEE